MHNLGVCMYACMHVWVHACLGVCVFVCMRVCVYACLDVCVFVCNVWVYAYL